MTRALATVGGLSRALRTRLLCAAAAFVGAMIPLVGATRWPSEIILFLLLAVGLAVPLSFYVLLIRTQVMSRVTGAALVFAGVVLPLPGYPDFLTGVAGRWGFVLLLLPLIMLALWLIGWLVDLVVRADRRLGDKGRPLPPPRPGSGLVLRPSSLPVRPGVVRGVASVRGAITSAADAGAARSGVGGGAGVGGGVRPPGITVEYRTADQPSGPHQRGSGQPRSDQPGPDQLYDPEQPPPARDRTVIEGDVITSADHPLD